jgi:RNA polymerase sigma-70 factor (sigma-E family)
MAMAMVQKAARTSERTSFEAFFEANYEPVLRAVYLITGDRHEAEDLAQEAFVKAYERWDSLREMHNPAGYVYRTALNAHRSRLRRIAVAARKSFGRREPDPLDASDDRDAIRRALAGLPVGQREAIVLVEWLDLADAEAAVILGISPVAVRVRISRGRKALKTNMRGDTDE